MAEARPMTDPVEIARLAAHWGGRACALEEAEQEAKKMSGAYFAAGDDRAAYHWRDVAAWLKPQAEAAKHSQQRFLTPPEEKK